MLKWTFGVIVIVLVVIAAFPSVIAWGKKAKDYFLDSFK